MSENKYNMFLEFLSVKFVKLKEHLIGLSKEEAILFAHKEATDFVNRYVIENDIVVFDIHSDILTGSTLTIFVTNNIVTSIRVNSGRA